MGSQAGQLDVYREWLGITDPTRPLNYYQLLRVKTFDDDAAKIRENYRKLNGHVRKYATGDYFKISQDLLNELAKAMLCLTDLQRKREYDATLGRKDVDEGRRRSMEEILLASKVIDRDQLAKARNFAEATGLEVRDALVQQKLASPEAVMQAYAESVGLPYIQLQDITIDESLIPRVAANVARHHSCLPVLLDGNVLLMASPRPMNPDVLDDLRLRFGVPVRTVLCTSSSISPLITQYYSADSPAAASEARSSERAASGRAAAPTREKPALSSEEAQRQKKLFAVVGFNMGVMLTIFLAVMLRGDMAALGTIDFVAAVFVGCFAAVGAFFLMK